jgi:hypothetical protein
MSPHIHGNRDGHCHCINVTGSQYQYGIVGHRNGIDWQKICWDIVTPRHSGESVAAAVSTA